MRNDQIYFVRKTCVVLILILFLMLSPITLTVAKRQLAKKNDKSAVNPIYLNLSFSTYMGGSDNDKGADIAVDNNGNCYIAGETESNDFPTKLAYDRTYSGGESDAFIAKFSTNGSLIWSTFLGGYSTDNAKGIAISTDGCSYVIGTTWSSNFPTKNAFDSTYNGNSTNKNEDVFVAKFSTSGSLLWSTFLGGNDIDRGNGIAVTDDGSCYVTGWTWSDNFPIENSYDGTLDVNDAFITKFSTNGSLLWSTFLGGNSHDTGESIAVTADGNCYVTGETSSHNFPTKNGYQNQHGGDNDAFVVEFSVTGSLLWSTFFGGNDDDCGYGIAVANDGSCYISGDTKSINFPIKDAYDNSFSGGQINGDAFVAKFHDNKTLLWSTFLGGVYEDQGSTIAVCSNGSCYVSGETMSDDFPVINALDNKKNGYYDAFISKFSTNGSLLLSTYLGGYNYDAGKSVALGTDGSYYLIGPTTSDDFPILNAFDATYNFNGDVFITKLFESTTPQPIATFGLLGFIVILHLFVIIQRKRKT